MKRALIVGTGTVAGVAAVLALNPQGTSVAVGLTKPASTSSPTTAGSPSGSSRPGGATQATPTPSASAPAASGGSTTATGTQIDVGYGIVQVQATVTGGRIVDITALALPQNDGRSARISNDAFPQLVQQALAAQSSAISGVSGASYTSYGFAESLKAALLSVGHAA